MYCTYALLWILNAVNSFTELGPTLLKLPNVKYLLSEVFSQDPLERYFSRQRHRGGSNEVFSLDPLERYFSRQRHRGGSNDNPTAYQVPFNASTLVQQRSIYRDIKTMNVRADTENVDICAASQPLPKRPRRMKSCE